MNQPEVRKCLYCGREFTLNSRNQKFCSYQCRWDNRAELRTLERRSASEGEGGLKRTGVMTSSPASQDKIVTR